MSSSQETEAQGAAPRLSVSLVLHGPSVQEASSSQRPSPWEPGRQIQAPAPAWFGKNSRRSRRISRGGDLHRKGKKNSRVLPPFPETPDVSVHSRETCFPCTALTFKPRINSHNGGTWDSPVGKPHGKAPDPLIHLKEA